MLIPEPLAVRFPQQPPVRFPQQVLVRFTLQLRCRFPQQLGCRFPQPLRCRALRRPSMHVRQPPHRVRRPMTARVDLAPRQRVQPLARWNSFANSNKNSPASIAGRTRGSTSARSRN